MDSYLSTYSKKKLCSAILPRKKRDEQIDTFTCKQAIATDGHSEKDACTCTATSRPMDVHKYKEPSRQENTMINMQQAKKNRGVYTYKEPSRHKDTVITVQQAKRQRRVRIQGAKQT